MILTWLCTLVAFAEGPAVKVFPVPPQESTVVSVYDGDTLTLASGDKVRLRWVNTPELKPAEAYGPEAREATEQFVMNRTVKLLLGGENPRDGYGRVVAGIETDEGNLSVHLLERGLGHLFIIPPDDTDLSVMIAAQAKARAARIGIWSNERYQGGLHITSFHANSPGDDRENVNGEYLRICNVSGMPLDLEGYSMGKATGKRYPLPSAMIPTGHTFELHSGRGKQLIDPAHQIELFLWSAEPIWSNDGDRATLYDRFGKVVDARDHEVVKATE